MSCTPTIRTFTAATRVVCFSNGGNAPATSSIHVLTDDEFARLAPILKAVRVTLIVENATSDCLTKAVLQSASDCNAWGVDVGLENNFTAGNSSRTTLWFTNLADFKRLIRLGVLVEQNSGFNTRVVCKVTMTVDYEV